MPVYCPKCKSPMTIRNGRDVPENKFYGCTKYPKCKGTREIDEVVPPSALTCNKDINQKIVSNLHKVVKRFR
jgi:ssDNA-binding Zn-finger/Zn-ribbon topoisomerase 1